MTISAALSLSAPVRLGPHAGRSPALGGTPSAPIITARTANAFSLPLAQLCDPQHAHADDACKAASSTHHDAEHLHALVFAGGASQLPAALRMLPYWRGARGAHKCIVYLEPRRSTPLYKGIEEFFRASSAQFGPTEAHQYHPHSSMTGFIDVAADAGQVMAKIACHLHALLAVGAGGRAPGVRAVCTTRDYPHAGTHKIEVKLDTPAYFCSVIDRVAKAVPEARIRPKRMGHISLAYCNKHVATQTVVSAEQAARLDALARSLLYTPDVFDPAQNPWDIAFYELSYKS
ncbi:hypothetical protein GGF43_004982, partial [Coemansia sp. RSA 2618]